MLIGVGRKQSARPTHRSGLRLSERYESAEFAAILDTPYARSIGKRQIALEPGSVPAVSIGARGPQLSFSGTQYLTTPSIGVGAEFTVLVGQTPRASNNGYDRMVETDYANSWFLGCNSSGANYCWIVNNASLEGCIGGSPTIGTRDLVVGTFAGSTRTLYVNGNQVASASATAPTPANRAMAIARQASGAAGYWEGEFDLLVVLPFAITAAEVRAIYEDEIGVLFAPRRIWVPVSAGGSTYPATLSESTTTTDAATAAYIATASVAESITAADSLAAATTWVRSLTEAATAAESVTTAGTFAASITEPASVADALTSAVTWARALTEAASASDLATAIRHAVAALTEAAAASDSQVTGSIYTGSVTEAASVSDALTAAATLVALLTEVATASDAATSAATWVRLLTEPATAVDSVAGAQGATYTASVTEVLAAAELLGAVLGSTEALGRYTIAAKARRLTITAKPRRLEIRK